MIARHPGKLSCLTVHWSERGDDCEATRCRRIISKRKGVPRHGNVPCRVTQPLQLLRCYNDLTYNRGMIPRNHFSPIATMKELDLSRWNHHNHKW